MNPPAPRPVVILGPTAGGKSELAVALAGAGLPGALPGGGEVLSADSMQVYRHMDAGTAKPTRALRGRVPHHLIDIVEPTERFTVADWLARAETLVAQVQQRGRWPILVGGTNLYLKAFLEGLFNAAGDDVDEAFRATLAGVPAPKLHERLRAVDPASAERIHPNDHRKLVRALEVFHLTGKPISGLQRQWEDFGARSDSVKSIVRYRHNPILIGLDWPTETINRRINARVKEMFSPSNACGLASSSKQPPESLPDETRRLESRNLLGLQAREALGYKQVLAAFRGEMTMDEAFERTKILTRRFAKTQRTWLKRYRGVHWLPAAEITADDLARRAIQIVNAA